MRQVRHILQQHLPVSDEAMDGLEASGKIVNTLCLDSGGLELYHNMLYGRPYSTQVGGPATLCVGQMLPCFSPEVWCAPHMLICNTLCT